MWRREKCFLLCWGSVLACKWFLILELESSPKQFYCCFSLFLFVYFCHVPGTFYLQSPPPLPTVQPPAQLPSTLRGAWRQSSYTAHSNRTNNPHKAGGQHSTTFKSNSVAGTPMTGVMPPGPFQVLTPTLVESGLESKHHNSNSTFNPTLTKRHFNHHF